MIKVKILKYYKTADDFYSKYLPSDMLIFLFFVFFLISFIFKIKKI